MSKIKKKAAESKESKEPTNNAESKLSDTSSMNTIVIKECVSIMDRIYGKYTNNNWIPKGYKKNHPRYLWTDAFGVVNYISLYKLTDNKVYLHQAKLLIDNVHNVLGKTRNGKLWLGNGNIDHPTLGGLRIGKPNEESDDDGDGQYFHYLTKWCYALNLAYKVTNESKYNSWSIEMGKIIFDKFVYKNKYDNKYSMFWKMKIDLSKPLVFAEGNLDPIDGYITYKMLNRYNNIKNIHFHNEVKIFKDMVDKKVKKYYSDDTLDLGESLWLSHCDLNNINDDWAVILAEKALNCLDNVDQNGGFSSKDKYRLAFREFGTVLGIKCLYNELNQLMANSDDMDNDRKLRFQKMLNICKIWNHKVDNILKYWEKKGIQKQYGGNDITSIMYVSCLIPHCWYNNFKS